MDPLKDYKRSRLPFNEPLAINATMKEVLLNDYGNVRAVVENGTIIIQTKKLKGSQREIARIDLNHQPPTIMFLIEG